MSGLTLKLGLLQKQNQMYFHNEIDSSEGRDEVFNSDLCDFILANLNSQRNIGQIGVPSENFI